MESALLAPTSALVPSSAAQSGTIAMTQFWKKGKLIIHEVQFIKFSYQPEEKLDGMQNNFESYMRHGSHECAE